MVWARRRTEMRQNGHLHLVGTLMLILTSVLSACATSAPQAQAPSTSAGAPQPAQSRAPRTLTLTGNEGNIGDFPGITGGSTGTGGGFVHDYLVVQDTRNSWI